MSEWLCHMSHFPPLGVISHNPETHTFQGYIFFRSFCAVQHILKFTDHQLLSACCKEMTHLVKMVLSCFCDSSFLKLNVSKIKDLCIDSQINPLHHLHQCLKGSLILTKTGKTAHQRLHFLCTVCVKCWPFSIDMQSNIYFFHISWFGNLREEETTKLKYLVKLCPPYYLIWQIVLKAITQNDKDIFFSIFCMSDHPLHCESKLLPSGNRFRRPKAKMNR